MLIKIVEIDVARAIPETPKYLERVRFKIIFKIIPILEFITGVFEFLKENYDKYISDTDRINRLNSFNLETEQDIKPQTLMPDFIKKQLGNM